MKRECSKNTNHTICCALIKVPPTSVVGAPRLQRILLLNGERDLKNYFWCCLNAPDGLYSASFMRSCHGLVTAAAFPREV